MTINLNQSYCSLAYDTGLMVLFISGGRPERPDGHYSNKEKFWRLEVFWQANDDDLKKKVFFFASLLFYPLVLLKTYGPRLIRMPVCVYVICSMLVYDWRFEIRLPVHPFVGTTTFLKHLLPVPVLDPRAHILVPL